MFLLLPGEVSAWRWMSAPIWPRRLAACAAAAGARDAPHNGSGYPCTPVLSRRVGALPSMGPSSAVLPMCPSGRSPRPRPRPRDGRLCGMARATANGGCSWWVNRHWLGLPLLRVFVSLYADGHSQGSTRPCMPCVRIVCWRPLLNCNLFIWALGSQRRRSFFAMRFSAEPWHAGHTSCAETMGDRALPCFHRGVLVCPGDEQNA